MKAKVIINNSVKYIAHVWFADDDIIGDCITSPDISEALDFDEEELNAIIKFFEYYNGVVEVLPEEE